MYNILLILSLLSGFIAGICWMLGDIYIVGYSVDNGEDLEYVKIRDNPNEIMYLGIAEQQLRKGALLAQWSVPFFFFSLP
ncbi:MAG: hypothetical protein Q4P28_03730, partial [Tissierellia bacterium]|nr:hypothetical protein [Tissierellia bacterium]